MARRPNPLLTPQELEIMKLVWQRPAVTVRDVYEALRARRKLAYTTVMTVMNILERKGYLKKRPEGRGYLYQPARRRERVLAAMVREFLGRVFDGSAEPLLVRLLEDRHLSERELAEVARRVREGR
jgi:predicted transcriptional regulator